MAERRMSPGHFHALLLGFPEMVLLLRQLHSPTFLFVAPTPIFLLLSLELMEEVFVVSEGGEEKEEGEAEERRKERESGERESGKRESGKRESGKRESGKKREVGRREKRKEEGSGKKREARRREG